MRVLVTGGAGFIGSHVVDALINDEHEVFVYDNLSTGRAENLPTHRISLRDQFEAGDILTDHLLCDTFQNFQPEAVIHLAAQAAISTSFENPQLDLDINARGTLRVLKEALAHNVRHFVFSSTSAVYDHRQLAQFAAIKEGYPLGPYTPYGISKLAAESYVRLLMPQSVILRFGNVIGPRQVPIGENQVLSRMIRHFKYGDKFYIHGSGRQKRDFVYVEDVANAVLAALDGKPGTYNIASGDAHSVNEMAAIVEEMYGAKGYAWEHTPDEDPREFVCLNISAAREGLNWEPKVGFRQAISQTVDWWNTFGVK